MYTSSVVLWLAIIGFSVAAIVAVASKVALRRSVTGLMITTSLAGYAAMFVYLSRIAPPTTVSVTISSPQTGEPVAGQVTWVSGTVDRGDVRVTVLVNPPNDITWWVQSVVYPGSHEGRQYRWSLPVVLGIPGQKNAEFKLVAIASSTTPWIDVLAGRNVRPGEALNALPLWAHSEPITVKRVQ